MSLSPWELSSRLHAAVDLMYVFFSSESRCLSRSPTTSSTGRIHSRFDMPSIFVVFDHMDLIGLGFYTGGLVFMQGLFSYGGISFTWGLACLL